MESKMSEVNTTFAVDTGPPVTYFDSVANRYAFKLEFTQRVLPVSIVFGLTACVGIFANLLVVYVYGWRYKRCNFKYFLFMMGVIGTVQCSIILPVQVAEMHYWFFFPTSWLCRASAYVFAYTVILCYLVLLLIATDRFRKVCKPYSWQIRSETARRLCVCVSCCSLIFALPPGIVSGNHSFTTQYSGQNITVTVCATDDMYQDRDWATLLLLMLGGIPVSIVILITCTLYGLILKQFYQGPGFQLQSFYRETNKNRISVNSPRFEKRAISNTSTAESQLQRKSVPRSPTIDRSARHSSSSSTLLNAVRGFFRTGDSIQYDSDEKADSGPLRTCGSDVSRSRVRNKLMRKTFIVLIITITCIVALVLTFGLHVIADDVNNNVLHISTAQLVAFVIFHRGSFSIICAIFPIVYGIRDHKFRDAFRKMFGSNAQSVQEIAQECGPGNSVCQSG